MTCARCSATLESDRLPRGWKRHDGEVWCQTCWRDGFVLRSIVLPVRQPVDCTWPELRSKLSHAWQLSTRLANWTVRELALNDVQRQAGEKKCPPMPPLYLYGAWRKRYDEAAEWAGATAGVIAVLHAVERRYRKTRYETVWTRARSVESYRYPYPYPVDADGWSLAWGEDGEPLVSICVPGGRVMLELRRGQQFRRQLGQLRAIAEKGEAAIYRKRIGGDSGQVATDGGQRFRVMVKLAAWLRKKVETELTGEMVVRSTPESFLVVEHAGEPWTLNADRVKGWIVAHERYRQRFAEDLKHEKRWPKRTRKRMLERLDAGCARQRNRLATWNHTAAKLVAEHARRRKVASVTLDLGEERFVAAYPWYDFALRLAQKLDERGIALVDASGEVTQEPKGVLEEDNHAE